MTTGTCVPAEVQLVEAPQGLESDTTIVSTATYWKLVFLGSPGTVTVPGVRAWRS